MTSQKQPSGRNADCPPQSVSAAGGPHLRPETRVVDPLLIAFLALGSWAIAPGADLAVWGWAMHAV